MEQNIESISVVCNPLWYELRYVTLHWKYNGCLINDYMSVWFATWVHASSMQWVPCWSTRPKSFLKCAISPWNKYRAIFSTHVVNVQSLFSSFQFSCLISIASNVFIRVSVIRVTTQDPERRNTCVYTSGMAVRFLPSCIFLRFLLLCPSGTHLNVTSIQ